MIRPFLRLLPLVTLVAVAACSSDTSNPLVADIHGGWKLVQHISYVDPIGVICDDTAHVAVDQIRSAFSITGSYTGQCHSIAPAITFENGPVDVVDGVISSGSNVGFSFGECAYQGTIARAGNVTTMAGTVQCSGAGNVGSGTWSMGRSDLIPPTVLTVMSPGQFSQGDTIVVTVTGSDNDALAWVGANVTFDAVNYAVDCPYNLEAQLESTTVSGTAAQRTFRAAVPWCAWYGHVTGIAVDTSGNRGEQELATFPIVLPESQVSATLDDSVYTLGDTAHIHVAATNSRGLSYIGYRYTWSGSQLYIGSDSVAVSGTSAQHDFTLALPAAGPYNQLYVTPIARHRLGWLTQAPYVTAALTDAVMLPVAHLTLPGLPSDIAYAALSDQIYVTDAAHSMVHQLGLAPLALGSSWTIAARGVSLDLSGSEDSLLVALQGQLNLAVVRVSTGSVQTVAITPPDLIDIYDARQLRVVGNGRALVLVGSGSVGSVQQLDLATGTQKTRVAWDGYGTLERSADRSRLLLINDGGPVGDQVYRAATDTFLPPQSGAVAVFGTEGSVSADDPITHWLVDCQLFTPDMGLVRNFYDPAVGYGGSAISRSGTLAYCPRTDGVVEFDVATGNRLRAIWLGHQPDKLRALPGNRLLAVSGTEMYLVTVQ